MEILDEAEADIVTGYRFYESQGQGLGKYFLHWITEDIRRLAEHSGIHPIFMGFHRALARKFPWAIYYSTSSDAIYVVAVLDCRRNPSELQSRLE
jgi:hypothetical protein